MGAAIKDSGQRQEFGTGSVRDTEDGKGCPELIPTLVMARLARWFELGKKKYGSRNWELGQPLSRYYASARRHMDKAFDGDESEDHEAAWMWNALAFMWTRAMIRLGVLPKELDDRPRYNGRLVAELENDARAARVKDGLIKHLNALEEKAFFGDVVLGETREERKVKMGVRGVAPTSSNGSMFNKTVFSTEYKLK
jgi:hypothetical protein